MMKVFGSILAMACLSLSVVAQPLKQSIEQKLYLGTSKSGTFLLGDVPGQGLACGLNLGVEPFRYGGLYITIGGGFSQGQALMPATDYEGHPVYGGERDSLIIYDPSFGDSIYPNFKKFNQSTQLGWRFNYTSFFPNFPREKLVGFIEGGVSMDFYQIQYDARDEFYSYDYNYAREELIGLEEKESQAWMLRFHDNVYESQLSSNWRPIFSPYIHAGFMTFPRPKIALSFSFSMLFDQSDWLDGYASKQLSGKSDRLGAFTFGIYYSISRSKSKGQEAWNEPSVESERSAATIPTTDSTARVAEVVEVVQDTLSQDKIIFPEELEKDAQVSAEAVLPSSVTFSTGKASLSEYNEKILNDYATYLLANPNVNLLISGHTDDIASNSYNRNLSKQRAELVKGYLVYRGISADRLSVVFFGELAPMSSNTTSKGRSMNRRVDLEFIRP